MKKYMFFGTVKKRYDFGDLFEVEEFRKDVAGGWLTDWDGSCHPVVGGKELGQVCSVNAIPPEATHVVWYNK